MTKVFFRRRLSSKKFLLQPFAGHRVERAERLVQEHDRRFGGERARNADALPLPARELPRKTCRKVRGRKTDQRQQLFGARGDLRRWPAQELTAPRSTFCSTL